MRHPSFFPTLVRAPPKIRQARIYRPYRYPDAQSEQKKETALPCTRTAAPQGEQVWSVEVEVIRTQCPPAASQRHWR
jgi:hypothetical protein